MTKLPQDGVEPLDPQQQITFDALGKRALFRDSQQPTQEEAAAAPAPKASEIAVPLTPHQLRRARARAAALDAQAGTEPKAFAPRWAVLTSLPARRPEKQEITRPIGDGERVHFVAPKEFGLPYGQDRLLPIFITSAYAALGFPEDRIITFRALSVIRDLFGIQEEGAAIKLKDGLRRWVHTGISLTTTTIDARTGKVRVVDRGDKLINASVLYSDEHKPNQYTVFQNAIRLTEWAADQAKKSLVPVRLALVRALRDNPGACSLALWSGYRANAVKRAELRVPLFGPEGLTTQLGYSAVVDDEGKPRKDPDLYEAGRQIARHLAHVKAEWPQCPHEIQGDEFVVRHYKTPPMELPDDFVAGLRRATPDTIAALNEPAEKPGRKP